MFALIKKFFGPKETTTPSASAVDESIIENFYTELAFYAQTQIGDDASLEMLEDLNGLCVFFKTPESVGLPNRGRTWELLADRNTGKLHQVVVFLDSTPLDRVVNEFFHDAWPAAKRIRHHQ